jgi:hypothetical protein
MTTEKTEVEKRMQFLQYLNTVILTMTLSLAGFIYANITGVKKEQEKMTISQNEFGKEILRIKTLQDINTAAIADIDGRVDKLELNFLDYIKNWVDQNYMRKPQQK